MTRTTIATLHLPHRVAIYAMCVAVSQARPSRLFPRWLGMLCAGVL